MFYSKTHQKNLKIFYNKTNKTTLIKENKMNILIHNY